MNGVCPGEVSVNKNSEKIYVACNRPQCIFKRLNLNLNDKSDTEKHCYPSKRVQFSRLQKDSKNFWRQRILRRGEWFFRPVRTQNPNNDVCERFHLGSSKKFVFESSEI